MGSCEFITNRVERFWNQVREDTLVGVITVYSRWYRVRQIKFLVFT